MVSVKNKKIKNIQTQLLIRLSEKRYKRNASKYKR